MTTIDANNGEEPDVSAGMPSVDEFIKQLEEREKDLDIPSDLVIEVDDSDVEHESIQSTFMPAAEDRSLNVAESAPEPKVDVQKKIDEAVKEVEKAYELKLASAKAQYDELRDQARRQKQDFENHRNRTERERKAMFNEMVARLATQMLPVLDNLDRALVSSNSEEEMTPKEAKDFVNGIVMVNQQLNEVLAGMGVEPIPALGQEFDPNFHEAVASEETDEVPAKTVLFEMLRGFKLGDKVIRASMVKVSASPSVVQDSNAEQEDDVTLETDDVQSPADQAEGYEI